MKKGPGYGCLTGVLDMAKAAVPVLVFKLVFSDHDYEFIVAATAVVGHNYPAFYRFRGGAGMSPYLGGLAVLDWLAVPVVTGLGVLSGLAVRNVVFAYASGVIWLIPWFWWRDGSWPSLAYALVVNVAVWTALWPVMKDLARKQKSGEIDTKEAMAILFDEPGQIPTGRLKTGFWRLTCRNIEHDRRKNGLVSGLLLRFGERAIWRGLRAAPARHCGRPLQTRPSRGRRSRLPRPATAWSHPPGRSFPGG